MSDPQRADSPAAFEYSGYLLFEPFRTRVQGRLEADSVDEAEHEMDRDLPTFERGSPESPGSGFEITNLRGIVNEAGLLDQYPELNDVISLKHTRESFEVVQVYDEGEFTEAQTVSVNSVDVYWKYPNFLYLRGAAKEREETLSRLRTSLVDSLYIEKVQFDTEFLIWLIYKYYLGEKAGGLEIVGLHNATLAGEEDEFGRENKVTGSQDLLYSAPILAGLLQGKDLMEIEGAIEYGTGQIRVKIGHDRVHLKSSSGILSQQSSVERISTALSFLTNLCDTHSNWTTLPPEDRYPPSQFFREVYQEALDQGVEVNSISSDVLQKYDKLRGEGSGQTDE